MTTTIIHQVGVRDIPGTVQFTDMYGRPCTLDDIFKQKKNETKNSGVAVAEDRQAMIEIVKRCDSANPVVRQVARAYTRLYPIQEG